MLASARAMDTETRQAQSKHQLAPADFCYVGPHGCIFQEPVKSIFFVNSLNLETPFEMLENLCQRKHIYGPIWMTVHWFAIWLRFRFLTQWEALFVYFY